MNGNGESPFCKSDVIIASLSLTTLITVFIWSLVHENSYLDV